MTEPGWRTLVSPLRAEEARLLRDDETAFRASLGLIVAAGYLEFPGALDMIVDQLDRGQDPEWFTHLVVDPAVSTVVGLGGYKGDPDDGVVEIGYGLAPEHRGRGHAARAVQMWVDQAALRHVRRVIAHTLAEPNPSTRVLERCGFVLDATVPEADLGQIWRWRRDLA
jgi:RimJ/RimL family protein N-acetyltransferase